MGQLHEMVGKLFSDLNRFQQMNVVYLTIDNNKQITNPVLNNYYELIFFMSKLCPIAAFNPDGFMLTGANLNQFCLDMINREKTIKTGLMALINAPDVISEMADYVVTEEFDYDGVKYLYNYTNVPTRQELSKSLILASSKVREYEIPQLARIEFARYYNDWDIK
jgi:hypothetical protein